MASKSSSGLARHVGRDPRVAQLADLGIRLGFRVVADTGHGPLQGERGRGCGRIDPLLGLLGEEARQDLLDRDRRGDEPDEGHRHQGQHEADVEPGRRCAGSPRGSKLDQSGVDREEGVGSVLGEGIPDAPHRPDVARLRRVRLDLIADVADVDVDRPLVLFEGVVVVAHQLEQLGAGIDPPGPRGEMAQEVELGGGQADALTGARDAPSLEVDDEVAAPEGATGLGVGQLPVGAAQERLDASSPAPGR